MASLFDLTGEIAVVIGGTGVLGGALAEGLAAAGAKVAILGRSEERGEACAARIQEAGGTAAFFSADALDAASLAAAHKAIVGAFGGPSILISAAGGNDPSVTVTADRPFERIALADWRANFDMNLAAGAGIRARHVRAGEGEHHQYRQRCLASAGQPRRGVLGRKGRGTEPQPVPRPRVGAARRAGEHADARVFPGGAKPAAALQ